MFTEHGSSAHYPHAYWAAWAPSRARWPAVCSWASWSHGAGSSSTARWPRSGSSPCSSWSSSSSLPASSAPPVRRLPLLLLAAALVIPLLVRSEYLIGTLTLIYFFAFVGQGWNILGGYAGQFSFGHALFFGVGAYTSSLCFLKLGLTPWVGTWRGAAPAVRVGLRTGRGCLRRG